MKKRTPLFAITPTSRRYAASTSLMCLALVLCAATAVSAPAQTFNTLLSFDGTDGAIPGQLVQGIDGNFYGTTLGGGGINGYGTVFRITPAGTLTRLHTFVNAEGDPMAGLVQATDGNLYGTTTEGGRHHHGSVFRITPAGEFTTLYSFCALAHCTDGAGPAARLVQATNGDFYGTTGAGGIGCCTRGSGDGTVFKIKPAGGLTTLYRFCSLANCTDGGSPYGGLVQASNGNFYGTTYATDGTVFEITPAGKLTTLYRFCSLANCTDGESPYGGLLQASNGNLYGTTTRGGASGYGTVFRIAPDGTLTTLYNFCAQTGCPDGANPEAGLVQATDGNFYGTTLGGGIGCCTGGPGGTGDGTVFKITPAGGLTTLYSFCSQGSYPDCADGAGPYARLVQATDGNFYGITQAGGVYGNYGTVFRLSTGLGPFVETLPSSGKVGAAVIILGTDLTGATSVSFNGTAATFTVVSATEITTTVPAGATTGRVSVTTPGGTLNSNVKFGVR